MIKYCFISLFLLINQSILSTQFSGVYSFIQGNSECMLTFYKDGKYEIDILSPPDYYGFLMHLSFGSYDVRDGKIRCKDQFNGYQLIFNIGKSKIVPIVAYFDFMNKEMIYSSAYSKYVDYLPRYQPETSKGVFKSIIEQRAFYKSKINKENDLIVGIYKNEDFFNELIIKKNGQYYLKNLGLIVSKGKWKREMNEILFHDENLNATFYSFIQNDGVIYGFSFTMDGNVKLSRVRK